MAVRTLADVRAELVTVNAAIQQIISGQRLTEIRIGSGDFLRVYKNQQVNLDDLYAIKAELQQEEDLLSTNVGITFRNDCNIPLVVSKFRR
jgi:hypothetical protein